MKEVACPFVCDAFERNKKIKKLEVYVDKENIASRKVVERVFDFIKKRNNCYEEMGESENMLFFYLVKK